MKKILYSAIGLLLVAHFVTKADPTIASFKAAPSSNNILSVDAVAPTTFTFSIDFTRSLTNNGGFEDVVMSMDILLVGATTTVLQHDYIGTGDFTSSAYCSRAYAISIPVGVGGLAVKLRYTYTSSNGVVHGPIELGTFFTINSVSPIYNKSLNGQFYRERATGAIYVCIEGAWRHIVELGTLQYIFTNPRIITIALAAPFGFKGTSVGEPLTYDSGFWYDVPNHKIYFRDRRVLRGIFAPVTEKYCFYVNHNVQLNSIPPGYVIGADIIE